MCDHTCSARCSDIHDYSSVLCSIQLTRKGVPGRYSSMKGLCVGSWTLERVWSEIWSRMKSNPCLSIPRSCCNSFSPCPLTVNIIHCLHCHGTKLCRPHIGQHFPDKSMSGGGVCQKYCVYAINHSRQLSEATLQDAMIFSACSCVR